jgi:hypothetical protein
MVPKGIAAVREGGQVFMAVLSKGRNVMRLKHGRRCHRCCCVYGRRALEAVEVEARGRRLAALALGTVAARARVGIVAVDEAKARVRALVAALLIVAAPAARRPAALVRALRASIVAVGVIIIIIIIIAIARPSASAPAPASALFFMHIISALQSRSHRPLLCLAVVEKRQKAIDHGTTARLCANATATGRRPPVPTTATTAALSDARAPRQQVSLLGGRRTSADLGRLRCCRRADNHFPFFSPPRRKNKSRYTSM